MTAMTTSNSDLPRGEGLRDLAGRLDIGADLGSLLTLAAVVVLGVLVLVGAVLLMLAILRRRRARAPVARAERSWRRRCAGELRELRSARASTAPPTWLLVGDPDAGAARLLERLDARPRPQHPDHPRWWITPGLRFVAVPEALSTSRRTWFFRQLRRRGSRGLAIHGALVPVDAVRLLSDESAALTEGGRHASALAELAAELRLELPLVLAVTGVERLPGAAEALPWIACGGEIELVADADGIEAALARGLDELRDALVTGLIAHAAAVDAPTTSAALLRTRQHLSGLEPPLRALIRRFDAAGAGRSRGHARPRMIGLFSQGNAQATNGAEAAAPALAGLLTALSGEAQPTRREKIRGRLRGALWTTAALALSVALARRIDAEQRDDRAALEATLATLETAAARPSAPALSRLDALAERWRGETSPRLDGAGLSTALDRYIDAALLRDVLEPSATDRARELDELVETDLDRARYDGLRDALEDYLRLTARSGADPCSQLPASEALAVDDPEATLELLARRPWPLAAVPQRDSTRVTTARRALARVDADHLLAWIADDLAKEGLPDAIEARQISRALTPRDLAVPGIYSRAAWPRVHRAIAEHSDRARCWAEDPAAFARTLRTTYARRYREAWERFADDLRIRRPRSLEEAHDLLDRLLDPGSAPLDAALRSLAANTQGLAAPPSPLAALRIGVASATAGDPAALTDVRSDAEAIAAAFRPLADYAGLDAYHGHLTTLRRELDAAADDPTAIEAVREAATAAITDTREAILNATADRRARERLRALLVPPLEAIVERVAANTGDHLRDAYCGNVAGPMRALLDGRYPWNPSARDEIPLRDLDALLHPRDGAIVRFLAEELDPWVVVEGSRLAPRPRGRGDRQMLDPAVLRFFAAALAASDALYVDDALRVDMTLTLRCTPAIHRVGLSLDDQDLHYTCADNGERPVHWPSTGDPAGAWLEIHGRGGVIERHARPGAWGLWRLLEERAALHPDGDALDARIDLLDEGLGDLPLRLRPAPSHRALFAHEALLGPLRDPDLRPPLHLFRDQERCADVR